MILRRVFYSYKDFQIVWNPPEISVTIFEKLVNTWPSNSQNYLFFLMDFTIILCLFWSYRFSCTCSGFMYPWFSVWVLMIKVKTRFDCIKWMLCYFYLLDRQSRERLSSSQPWKTVLQDVLDSNGLIDIDLNHTD